MTKQKGGARFAPKGPQGVRYKRKGRLVGTDKGGNTNQEGQGPQPVAKKAKKSGTRKFKFAVGSNKYKIGR